MDDLLTDILGDAAEALRQGAGADGSVLVGRDPGFYAASVQVLLPSLSGLLLNDGVGDLVMVGGRYGDGVDGGVLSFCCCAVPLHC
ncbi:hypothetical protein [Variovorax arabinosiphilus]|uniref:hypothetical protein n=1 Tax=Variovorax arabinosiphilus TaxID=3053498 RepID=UPI0025758120|nr:MULTISPECIES: hypothetical protein [unclassified Variovorax]MDM0118688.1 hypothetical protein [Variovorax sp. J2L1-78]MDM0129113.1 hypothetical protein [Variovorax sp. J2L1-63]MDM0233100.1 hypothetical protein [Variovorax sp. J2R1-6]